MKNKKILTILVILGIVFMIIGGTFAYFSWATNASQATEITFTVASGFSCGASGGGNITSNDKMLAPSSCTDTDYAIQRTVTVSAVNNTAGSIYLNMNLKINSIGTYLSESQNFKYALTKSSNSCTTNVIASGEFTGAQANDTFPLLVDKEYQTTNNNDVYYLYIWLDEAETNPNTMNQTFDISLEGGCSNQTPSSIIYTISDGAVMDNVASTYVTSSTGINWNDISSDANGKGLYIRSGTEDDPYPVYYYRGEVTNNNVLFADFCWKIVRTTSTGGTKLIYNGLPSNGTCNNTGTDSQLASTSAYSVSSINSPAKLGYMYGNVYETTTKTMISISDTYMYGTGYDETNHRLVSTGAMNFSGTDWGTYYNQINNNHYTCFNTTGECENVYYIYHTNDEQAYYIQIPYGKTINGIIDEMVTGSSNTTNSSIKTAIDAWYVSNMTSYTSYLEDTPYCNDRTIYTLGGWNSTGSTTMFTDLYMISYARSLGARAISLTCSTYDSFTVSSLRGNGKLAYPVGLLTMDEVILVGGHRGTQNSYYLSTGQNWWTMSPTYFNRLFGGEVGIYLVNSNGGLTDAYGFYTYGVRPVVSLRVGTRFRDGDGDGSPTNPYKVQMNKM